MNILEQQASDEFFLETADDKCKIRGIPMKSG
jgi:hypothetical protein